MVECMLIRMTNNNNNLLFILRKYPYVYDQMRTPAAVKIKLFGEHDPTDLELDLHIESNNECSHGRIVKN